nr:TPA_asm: ND5 [Gammarus chevreuxi]
MSVSTKIYSVFSVCLLTASGAMFMLGLNWVVLDYCVIIEWMVWGFNSSSVTMSLVFDWMSWIFLGSVCLISGCIMKYSEYYMEGENNYTRFVYILFMFVLSMWLLIISPNLISLLLGWDGLGLTSYALVIFYQSESSCNAGMLTVLSNRIGDVAILLSIGLMFGGGSWDFYNLDRSEDLVVVALVILAGMTKSAQLPFSAWLPAAMAAPTPVSALVHSSTLVTAGVYLLIRFSPVIEESGLSKVLLVVSVMTMVMAGVGAMFESDMKKVVALSTLSQLGLMMMTLSVGMKELAFFHLISHAMFKSTLFMCAGFMIHSVGGSQDSRVMSGFAVSSPVLGVMLSGTNLALCGFPFLAGFYSKDALLEHMFMSSLNSMITMMVIFGTGLTVAYSLRVLYLSSCKVSAVSSVSGLGDSSKVMVKSMWGLFMATLVMGFFMYWVIVPVSLPFFLSDPQKGFIVGVSLLGGLCMYKYLQSSSIVSGPGVKVMEHLAGLMWFMPFISTKLSSLQPMKLGYSGLKLVDSGWLEFYGGQGGRKVFLGLSSVLQKGQGSALVSSYMVTALMSAGIVMFIL